MPLILTNSPHAEHSKDFLVGTGENKDVHRIHTGSSTEQMPSQQFTNELHEHPFHRVGNKESWRSKMLKWKPDGLEPWLFNIPPLPTPPPLPSIRLCDSPPGCSCTQSYKHGHSAQSPASLFQPATEEAAGLTEATSVFSTKAACHEHRIKEGRGEELMMATSSWTHCLVSFWPPDFLDVITVSSSIVADVHWTLTLYQALPQPYYIYSLI
jgi:hypothetical protein